MKSLGRVQLFTTPWTVAFQAPLPMEFSRQEYWSGLPFPSPGDIPKPGIEPRSLPLKADALPSETPGKPASQVKSIEISSNDTAAAAAKSLQSCPTLCDPTDGRPPGSPIPGILRAILEWAAISFFNA